jgi:RecB family exonuclease
VPSSVDADLFLPNQVRQQLGVLDNDRRYARDAYALSTMLASREHLTLIAGRRNGRGDPLLPSRLALAGDDKTMARRMEQFFTPGLQSSTSLPPIVADDRAQTQDEAPGLVVPSPQKLAEPKRTFSVTAFRDYIACPYRFYLKHILKLSRVDDEADEMSPRQFGDLLHDVLSEFGVSAARDATAAREISEFLKERLAERAALLFGRWRGPAIDVQIEQARARLDAFADWQSERKAAGWSIAFVEQPSGDQAMELPVDENRSLTIHGRIDRIDRHSDGRWAIFDYKTGDEGKSPEKTHRHGEEWIDLQLPLYRELAALLGVVGEIELGYINLSADTSNEIGQLAEWTAADLDSARARALEIARNILDQRFLPVTDLHGQPYDDFAAICQQGVFDRRLPT